MKLRNAFMTAIACSVLVIAGGNRNQDTNGGMDGAAMGDTTVTTGTIQQFNAEENMLIVQSDRGTDTIYITEETEVPQMDQLQPGTQVEVEHMRDGERKVAIRVTPAANGGMDGAAAGGMNGAQEGEMITGTIQEINETDSMLIIETDTGIDTVYFDQQTEMQRDELQQGQQVQINYRTMQDRKIATQIRPADQMNGQMNGQKQNGQKQNGQQQNGQQQNGQQQNGQQHQDTSGMQGGEQEY